MALVFFFSLLSGTEFETQNAVWWVIHCTTRVCRPCFHFMQLKKKDLHHDGVCMRTFYVHACKEAGIKRLEER